MISPRACDMARFLVVDTPKLPSFLAYVTRWTTVGANSLTTPSVSSLDPSSITMISQFVWHCSRMPSSARLMNRPALYAGTMTLTNGMFGLFKS